MLQGTRVSRNTVYMVAFGAALLTLIIMALQLSEPPDRFIVAIALWNILPYGTLILMASFMGNSIVKAPVIVIGTLIVSVLSVLLLLDAFWLHTGAQNGLAFIFLPVYQLLACLVIALVALCWPRSKPKDPPASV